MKFGFCVPSLRKRIAARTSLALAGLLLVGLLAGQAFAAEESRIYDAQGRYQGRATTNTANPQQKSLYDAKGRYVGRVMTDDNGSARVYDSHGKYQGRATGWPKPKSK
ncbi:hypothetical protein [Solidesulfovibrio sp.]